MGVFGDIYINGEFISGFKIIRNVLPVDGTDDWYKYYYEYWYPSRPPGWVSQRAEGVVEHKRSNGLEKLLSLVMEDVHEQFPTVVAPESD